MSSAVLIPVPPDEQGRPQWACRIDGGTAFRVAGYALEPASEGAAALLTLVIAADAVSIGDAGIVRTAVPDRGRNQPPTSTWGNTDVPDPRANIPGWVPSPAAVDAQRERTGEHRMITGRIMAAVRRLVHGRGWRLA